MPIQKRYTDGTNCLECYPNGDELTISIGGIGENEYCHFMVNLNSGELLELIDDLRTYSRKIILKKEGKNG